ncbi:MAG TPA: beta-propeller fold lactonase family protein [Candidatus Sulfotelmatobacter sp.]|nr:beta-propeller fold lactonase family protein [Candidatus Sulfotelmatobacter sp.]
MRPFRTPVQLLLSVLIVLQTAQAKVPYAYVANNTDNTVTVIDTSSGTVVKTIAVGSFPYGVAVNQAGTFAYVTNSGSNTVSVISTATNAVVSTITLTGLSGPLEIALSPNGKTAYVSSGNSNAVAVINTATRTFKSIAVQNPIGVAVTPTGAFVYVVSSAAGKVLVISTLTNVVVATIAVGTNIPIGVVISPDGTTAYVTNYNAHTVTVIQTGNNVVAKTINVSAGPFHEAVSPDGHWLYVANYNAGGGDLVTVINTSTQTVAGTVVVGTGPNGLAFTQDSAFVGVTNESSNTVSVINTASRTVTQTIPVGKGPIGGAVLGPQTVSTVAGGFVGDNRPATGAAIEGPAASVLDSAGNLYVSDVYGNRIRKITPTGTITTYAGDGICGYNGDNISSTLAMLCLPSGIALDAGGNLIVADQVNGRIRKISTAGKISTIAGNGLFGCSGNGGPAAKASIAPFSPTYDSSGNLYFSNVISCVVSKVNTSGVITTVAGTGRCGYNGDNIPATTAQLDQPLGVTFDSAGNLYIADAINHRIRIVTPSGTINTFAGNGKMKFSGDGGLATLAGIGNPRSVLVKNGVLYISRGGQQRFRQVNLSSKIISTYAGSGPGYDGDGNSPLLTLFNGSFNILFDSAGNPVFDDALNGRVRKASGGIVKTIAGGFIGDGGADTAGALVFPEAVAIDKFGNFYIADYAGNRVRKVSGGKISTIAGTGISGFSGDGGNGQIAKLSGPQGVVADSVGNVFIADTLNGRVRKVNTTGTISTFAANVNFTDLLQMAADSANNLYVADDGVCVVWKITPAAVVSIVAGVLGTCGYNGDGIKATAAELNGPSAVAMDASGNLLLADYANSRVREVNTSGFISTVAGNGTCNYTGDGGSAAAAELCPWGIAVDNKSGMIYVSDLTFDRIRKIRGGTITTFASFGFGFNGDGLWPLSTGFDDPVALAVDSTGAVYVLDDSEHRLRKIQ